MSVCDEFDCFVLTETWLDDSIDNSEIFSSNFQVFRCDRNLKHLGIRRGGGVLIAVNKKYNCSEINVTNITSIIPSIDLLGISLRTLQNQRLSIFVVYIPPSITFRDYECFLELVSDTISETHSDNVVFLGDFNSPLFGDNSRDNNFSVTLNNFASFQNFVQYNKITNEYNGILDLIFSNIFCKVYNSDISLVPEDPFHPTLKFDIELRIKKNNRFSIGDDNISYNFKKANFPCLYNALLNIDWSSLYAAQDVNHSCDVFYCKLRAIFKMYVPKVGSYYKKRSRYPIWFDKTIINCLQQKSSMLKKYRKSSSPYLYGKFKHLRSEAKRLIAIAYSTYINNVENMINKEPKKFWSFIKSKKRGTRIPGSMFVNDEEISNPNDIVNHFAEYFRSVFTTSTPVTSNISNKLPHNIISILSITEDETLQELKRAKNTMTAGCDGVPSFILRDCANVFAKPLCHIFNRILKTSIFPSIWKLAYVCPVLKKGDENQIRNYRPISILCNFSKVFESLLYNRIYCSVRSFISPYQHGFMEKRSTVTNLTCLSQFVSEALDRKSQVDVVYTDFQKAFDQIDHYVLLKKLDSFGFSTPLLTLIESYLMQRQQRVRYSNYISKAYMATSGVPQGSNLGPLLFTLFINDITEYLVACLILLFADDLKLYLEIKSLDDCRALQSSLDALDNWCRDNRLQLNLSKCNVMSFTIKHHSIEYCYNIASTPLTRVQTIKDLGVIFDAKLTFKHHIREVVNKALKSYGFIYRNCREFANTEALCTLYSALVRTRLEYCVIVWYPLYNIYIEQLEKVQRRFLKYLLYKRDGTYPIRGYDHCLILKELKFDSLQVRRNCVVVKFVYNLTHNKIDCPWLLGCIRFAVQRWNSRTHLTFYAVASRTNIGVKAPMSLMSSLFNKLCKNCDINHDCLNSILLEVRENTGRNLGIFE